MGKIDEIALVPDESDGMLFVFIESVLFIVV